MAHVVLKKINKTFKGNIRAVKDVNLDIKDKEFLVMVGPSGCGKSTTLRMIAGLENATSGEVYIDDKVVNSVPAKDRDIAMVFQNYALYPHLNVFENMAFGLKLRRYPKEEIKKRVVDAAKILNIEHLLDRRPKEISGGERQRTAVGRAIVRKPSVFLFDEPLSNLDAMMRVQMRTEISKLYLKLQTTMIYVTHDQAEAMTMGTEIAVMHKGYIQQCDEPIEIYDRPANKFVAGFVGSPPMNFIEGRIISKDNQLYFKDTFFILKVHDSMQEKLQPHKDKEVIFGIRPEHLYDKVFVPQASQETTVRLTCEVVELMGHECYIYLGNGNGATQLVARVRGHHRPPVHQDIEIVMDMARAHFFDKHSEKAIV